MATKFFFDNKEVSLPGAYSTIKSVRTSPMITATYGRVLVIDNGQGAEWGGGSGISGDGASGADSVYRFTNLQEYQTFLKGGLFWKAAEALFKPAGSLNGVSEVIHVRAATTTKASMTFSPTGGGTAGGTFKVNTKDEGISANGFVTGTGADMHLDKGYAFSVESGVKDTDKFIFKIWRGTWRGDHTDGIAYDEISKADTRPELIVSSPEFDNVQELIDWANSSNKFNVLFSLDDTSTVTGEGTVTTADLTDLDAYNLATGGTETYSSTSLDEVLETVQELDYSFLLSDQYGTNNYDSAQATKMFVHLKDEAKFMKFMFVGGGQDEDEWDTADGTIDIAKYFDDTHSIVVHGGVKKTSSVSPSGFRIWDSFVHTAYVLGRTAGLEPQVPVTNKWIDVDGVVHNMKKSDKELALEFGVITTQYNEYTQTFNVLQGVNTLQNNNNIVNPDATSFSIQMMRVVSQINRELVINASQQLLAEESGVNMNTLSKGTLENWTKNYLQTKVATEQQDNLIISYKDVTVTQQEDSYFVNYKIVVNGEITKIFFTGFLLN